MVETIDFILHFGGETDAMQFIAPTKAAHYFADFTDFADDWTGITVFDIDVRFHAARSVIVIVRNIAGAIFDEIVLGREARTRNHGPRVIEKIGAFVWRHIQIDRFEQTAIDKSKTEVS